MPRIIDYAFLSLHVYQPTHKNNFGLHIKPFALFDPIPIHGWHVVTDLEPNLSEKNNFFAQLYILFLNRKIKDAVIAVRGTIPSKINNDFVDVMSWTSSVVGTGKMDFTPIYFSLIRRFTFAALAYCREFLGLNTLKITGHSLGGALAQLIPLKTGLPIYAVVFNSPGVGTLRGLLKNNEAFIYNINSRYGIINKIGKTLGRLEYIDVPEMQIEAKAMFDHQNKTEYNLAIQLEQNHHIVDHIAGMTLKLSSYVQTATTIKYSPWVQQQLTQCSKKAAQENSYLMKFLHQEICDTKVTLHSLEATIAAQHSMQNMLSTLMQPNNAKIAYQQL